MHTYTYTHTHIAAENVFGGWISADLNYEQRWKPSELSVCKCAINKELLDLFFPIVSRVSAACGIYLLPKQHFSRFLLTSNCSIKKYVDTRGFGPPAKLLIGIK